MSQLTIIILFAGSEMRPYSVIYHMLIKQLWSMLQATRRVYWAQSNLVKQYPGQFGQMRWILMTHLRYKLDLATCWSAVQCGFTVLWLPHIKNVTNSFLCHFHHNTLQVLVSIDNSLQNIPRFRNAFSNEYKIVSKSEILCTAYRDEGFSLWHLNL